MPVGAALELLSRISSSTHLRKTSIFNLVRSSLSSFSCFEFHQVNFSVYHTNFSSSSSFFFNSSNTLSHTHLKSPPITIPHVTKLVIKKFPYLWGCKVDNFSTISSPLHQILLRISYASPQTCRRFLRVSSWTPEHVLEVLLGFHLSVGDSKIEVEIVENLWEFFRKVDDRNVGFKHLGRSYEVMASMLINVGMLREVEMLLSDLESQGVLLVNDEIFSGLVDGYVNVGVLERALLMYDAMKRLSLVPSLSCYRSLLGLLVKEDRVDQAVRIFVDVIEAGFEFGDVEARSLEGVIGILCRDGKIREARNLLKKIIVGSGRKLSTVIVSEVSDAYCEKKDFEALLSFFTEMKCVPNILIGNKIINLLCNNFGIGRAYSFMLELENLGFTPNEITFGILICWSCADGNLRDAFVYLSEVLYRGMKPNRRSYNSLISGLFKAGMQEHAGEILREMIDNGIRPNMATYRALLAGYSRARRFNEVKLMMSEMVNYGMILMSPLENPISKAFAVLGLNPLAVKLKRDNDIKNFRTEFVDTLGNGLYLDADIDEFEKTVMGVLVESLIPDFNMLVMKQCDEKNAKEALLMVDEMLQWGQELSLLVLPVLVRLLCESKHHVKAISALIDKVFQPFCMLDHETLNLLVEALSNNGFVDHCRLLLHEMYRRHLPIFNETYTAVLVALCKLGNTSDILHWWGCARENNWSPDWDVFIILAESLCRRDMFNQMLELEECRKQLDKVGYSVLFHGFSEGNDLPRLRKFMNSMIIKGIRPRSLSLRAMIGYFFRTGQDHDALQLGNQIESRESVLFSTVHYAVLNGLFSDGRTRTEKEVNYCNNVIWNFCQNGKLEQAVILLDQCLKMKSIPDVSSYDCVVQTLCGHNNLECAMEYLYEMLHRNLKPSIGTWDMMIQKFSRYSDTKGAENLLLLMIDVGGIPTKEMYSSVIDRYRLERNLSRASELLNRMQRQGYEPDFVTQWSLISSFSNSNDQNSSIGTEGFLSNLLVESGFSSEIPKSKAK